MQWCNCSKNRLLAALKGFTASSRRAPDSVLEGKHERKAGHLVPLPLGPVEVHHSPSNGDVPEHKATRVAAFPQCS